MFYFKEFVFNVQLDSRHVQVQIMELFVKMDSIYLNNGPIVQHVLVLLQDVLQQLISKFVLMDFTQLLFKDKMLNVLNVLQLTKWLIVIMLVMLQAVLQDIVLLMEFVKLVLKIQLHVMVL